jgi:quercetin dioxygenase-like cupin family protein
MSEESENGSDDTSPAHAPPGHNQPREEVVWERWTKKRTFVRALEGTYGELVHELFKQPRVIHAKDSAVFYVLKGKGHDVHDGRRIDWQAGDALIVENACVHQHFNDDPEEDSLVLIMKAKPLFLFMHMLFQKVVDYPPKEPVPGQEDYTPPDDV